MRVYSVRCLTLLRTRTQRRLVPGLLDELRWRAPRVGGTFPPGHLLAAARLKRTHARPSAPETQPRYPHPHPRRRTRPHTTHHCLHARASLPTRRACVVSFASWHATPDVRWTCVLRHHPRTCTPATTVSHRMHGPRCLRTGPTSFIRVQFCFPFENSCSVRLRPVASNSILREAASRNLEPRSSPPSVSELVAHGAKIRIRSLEFGMREALRKRAKI
ncbi:hypothetical protein C8R45DRAFT_389795 [Mycena sanguinolenta]|nr:hypothetical protein C8R45DRAFT_389795 [Mycena sanguinolenta]